MSMSQSEWSRRVAEIGALAGWSKPVIASHQSAEPSFNALAWMQQGKQDPAVIAAIRQLDADWLDAEGVVAVRVCRWTFANGAWGSGCGRHWTLPGDLSEMCFSCCPRCGGKIEVAP